MPRNQAAGHDTETWEIVHNTGALDSLDLVVSADVSPQTQVRRRRPVGTGRTVVTTTVIGYGGNITLACSNPDADEMVAAYLANARARLAQNVEIVHNVFYPETQERRIMVYRACELESLSRTTGQDEDSTWSFSWFTGEDPIVVGQ